MLGGTEWMPVEYEYSASVGVQHLKRVNALDNQGKKLPGQIRAVLPNGPSNSKILNGAWLNLSVGELAASVRIWAIQNGPNDTPLFLPTKPYSGKTPLGDLAPGGTAKLVPDIRFNIPFPADCDTIHVKFYSASIDVPVGWSIEIDPK